MGDQVEAFRQGFNQNHAAYCKAFLTADGHVSVLRAVVNDLSTRVISTTEDGGVEIIDQVTRGDDGSIDWNYYYGQYNEYMKQQAEEAKANADSEGNVMVSPEEFDKVVFGGDYDGNREVPEEHGSTSEENPGDEQSDSGDDDSPRTESE